MNISASQSMPMLPASLQAKLSQTQSQQPSDIEQAATDFESVFVSMLLKSMRSSLGEGGFFSSDKSDSYGGIFDLYLGKHLASSDALGIGRLVEEAMQGFEKS